MNLKKTAMITFMVIFRFLLNQLNQWRVEHTLMAFANHFKPLWHLPVPMKDGRILYLDLRNAVCMPYFLWGDFSCEQYETKFAKQAVNQGETAIDIGANVGWYTSLLAQAVGINGKVYAFEPNPKLAQLLSKLTIENCNVTVIQAGLGAENTKKKFSIPENWISGSFGKVDKAVENYEVKLYTVDSFLEKEHVPKLTFIKCDAEGAELDILNGAKHLLQSEKPPIWMIEMSTNETTKFGYHPKQIIEYFKDTTRSQYGFLMIDQKTGKLKPLTIPSAEPFWFNAVFIPKWLQKRRC